MSLQLFDDNICVLCKTAEDAGQNLVENLLLVNYFEDGKCGHKLYIYILYIIYIYNYILYMYI